MRADRSWLDTMNVQLHKREYRGTLLIVMPFHMLLTRELLLFIFGG